MLPCHKRSKQTPKTHLPKYCRIQILETRDNRICSTRCKLSYWKTTPQNSTSLSHNLQEEIHQTVGENHIRIQNLKLAPQPITARSRIPKKQNPKNLWSPIKTKQDHQNKFRKKDMKNSKQIPTPEEASQQSMQNN